MLEEQVTATAKATADPTGDSKRSGEDEIEDDEDCEHGDG